jgi:hypothetical protein
VIVLFTYIFPLDDLRSTILSWVVIAAAAALLIGVVNLLTVHMGKLRQGKGLYSFVLVFSLAITFAVTFLDIQVSDISLSDFLFTYIQVPVETSLMAVMAVTLTYAAARLATHRPNIFSFIFGATLVLTLLASGPILGIEVTFLQDIVNTWIIQTFASAGARGILLGVGLGTIATGLRILMGVDRPYGG